MKTETARDILPGQAVEGHDASRKPGVSCAQRWRSAWRRAGIGVTLAAVGALAALLVPAAAAAATQTITTTVPLYASDTLSVPNLAPGDTIDRTVYFQEPDVSGPILYQITATSACPSSGPCLFTGPLPVVLTGVEPSNGQLATGGGLLPVTYSVQLPLAMGNTYQGASGLVRLEVVYQYGCNGTSCGTACTSATCYHPCTGTGCGPVQGCTGTGCGPIHYPCTGTTCTSKTSSACTATSCLKSTTSCTGTTCTSKTSSTCTATSCPKSTTSCTGTTCSSKHSSSSSASSSSSSASSSTRSSSSTTTTTSTTGKTTLPIPTVPPQPAAHKTTKVPNTGNARVYHPVKVRRRPPKRRPEPHLKPKLRPKSKPKPKLQPKPKHRVRLPIPAVAPKRPSVPPRPPAPRLPKTGQDIWYTVLGLALLAASAFLFRRPRRP